MQAVAAASKDLFGVQPKILGPLILCPAGSDMIPRPIQNTEFINDFWLSLIDNLTLVVLAVFGYWTSRRLEAIKSREEARKAMIDQRMATILDQWFLVRYFHFDVVDAWGESDPEVGKDEARHLVDRYEPLRRSIR